MKFLYTNVLEKVNPFVYMNLILGNSKRFQLKHFRTALQLCKKLFPRLGRQVIINIFVKKNRNVHASFSTSNYFTETNYDRNKVINFNIMFDCDQPVGAVCRVFFAFCSNFWIRSRLEFGYMQVFNFLFVIFKKKSSLISHHFSLSHSTAEHKSP